MRAFDPTIRFIAVGDNDMEWNRTVLRTVGRDIDYLAIHHYYGRKPMAGDIRNLMARPLFYERFYQTVSELIAQEVPDRTIQLAINEWGLDLPEALQYSMHAALYGARLMHVFERSSPLVGMSAVSDLVNGWPGGIIQASRHGVFVSPLYHVHQMYSTHRGAERLLSRVDGPTFDSTSEGRQVPVLDVVASRTADGGKIFLKLVNTDLEQALDVAVRVLGASVGPRADRVLLTADSLADRTSFRAPDAVRPEQDSIEAGASFTVRVPKHSVSALTLETRR
jgi:alpha-N-arabinofuranosidase